MSLDGRMNELAAKHRNLDHRIAEEQKRPSADNLVIKDLKRRKLKIKEELSELKQAS